MREASAGGRRDRARWRSLGHFLWNSPLLSFGPTPPLEGVDWLVLPIGLAAKGLPLLLFVVVALRLARRRERRWLDAALAAEIDGEGLTRIEFETLRSPARRRAAVEEMRRRAGVAAARLLARLQREQINLAMIASRVAAPDDPALRAAARVLPVAARRAGGDAGRAAGGGAQRAPGR